MGCSSSKNKLSHVDDSVHRMLTHDRKVAKSKGETTKGYVPRAPHPLLQPTEGNSETLERPSVVAVEEEDDNILPRQDGLSR